MALTGSGLTVGEVLEEALHLADQPALEKTRFIDRSQLLVWFNYVASELYELLASTFEEFHHKETTITIVSGQEDYDLPADFWRSKKIWFTEASRRFKVIRHMLDELDGLITSPISSGSIELWYVPQMPRFADEGNVVGWVVPVVGWEEYLSTGLALRMLTKEQNDTSGMVTLFRNIKDRILRSAQPRDAAEPRRTQDVTQRFGIRSDMWVNTGRSLGYRLAGNRIKFFERTHRLGGV